jgi:DNA-binding PucR family transcriptional regulator
LTVDQKAQIPSLRDVASLVNSGTDLPTVLQHLVLAACRHANWTMGSIMSIDAAEGYAYVMCRHDPALLQRPLPDRWELATSPSGIALRRNEPVYIRDARQSEEFPEYRREAFERDYRSVLVVPMNCKDTEDRPMVLSLISREIMDITSDDLAFIGLIVHLGEIAVDKQHRLLNEKRAAALLQSALQAHTSLLSQALSEASVASLAATVNALLPNPIVVVDFSTNMIVAGRSPSEAHYDDDAWRQAGNTTLHYELLQAARHGVGQTSVTPRPLILGDGVTSLRSTPQIEALKVDGEAVGALMIFPAGRKFEPLDRLLLDSARFAFSVQLMRSFVRFRLETRTLTDLFSEIIERRWRNAGDVMQRAQRLGINLDIPRQMLIVDFPQHAKDRAGLSVDLHHATMRVLQQSSISAAIVTNEGGLVCLIPVESAKGAQRIAKLQQRIAGELGRYFTEKPVVVLSSECAALADYAPAWDRCQRMIRIARAFGRTGALSGPDFGPLPVLTAAADSEDVREFVRDSVGSIIAHDREHGTAYLETLTVYLREGCRNQACADAMSLHVTTLRYRLSRIAELFGVNVETPERRFALELAIRLHSVIDLVGK